MQYTIESIKSNILDWVENNIGLNFSFRKYQLESIMFIIKSILNDNRETSIIEAPTGSGKSLICIICAGVLSKYYHKSSYILCSDLFLWQQYADFIDKMSLYEFGYIKGAIGNYTCFVNKQDLSCGRCKLAKVSYGQLRDKNWRERNMFTCVERCKYMQDRFRAERSNVTLMTYQLWLHHMNLVNQKAGTSHPFPKRDVVFCDECHNIPDLVQQFCSPTLRDQSHTKKLMDILDYAEQHNIEMKTLSSDIIYDEFFKPEYLTQILNENKIFDKHYTYIFDNDNIKDKLDVVFTGLNYYHDDAEQIITLLKLFRNILTIVANVNSSLEDEIQHESLFNTKNMDKDMETLSKRLTWFHTFGNSFEDFMEAIKKSGTEYMLMEVNVNPETHERTYQFNCAKEDYLCNEYLLSHANNKVLLSATVGSHHAFDENIGTKYTKQHESFFSKIPSTFDFSRSPIYYIPKYKMNYANKSHDFPMIQQMATKIINAHNQYRGIIHTGSYENARLFYNSVPYEVRKRLFLYGTPKQKEEIMPDFKKSTNGILVGPTLTEGIDLPDDYCRFIILMKVPYPNITSKIVKKKLELFPLWYNCTTSNIIIQSIGRGVRNEHDYCTTYILDGCFGNLYQQTKEQYSPELQNRIKIIYA